MFVFGWPLNFIVQLTPVSVRTNNKRAKIIPPSASEAEESGAEGRDNDGHFSLRGSEVREEMESASSSPPPPARIHQEEAPEREEPPRAEVEEMEEDEAALQSGVQLAQKMKDAFNDIDSDYQEFYIGEISVRTCILFVYLVIPSHTGGGN